MPTAPGGPLSSLQNLRDRGRGKEKREEKGCGRRDERRRERETSLVLRMSGNERMHLSAERNARRMDGKGREGKDALVERPGRRQRKGRGDGEGDG